MRSSGMILERMEGPTPPHLAPSLPPACLPLGHWVQVVGKWLLGDGCQVTTVVSRAEGSHQLVRKEKGRWANSGVLAGREGGPAVLCPHPATRDPVGQLGTQPRNRKETRERKAGGGPVPPGPWWEGHEPPRPGQEKCGSWGWQPPMASSFAQDQVCLPEPIPGRAS